MPEKKICRCGKLIDPGEWMCPDCLKRYKERHKKYEKQRGNSTQRGYDADWRRYRIMYLREHPLCVECLKEDKVTAATVVDHIIPHKGNKELFWDPKNHQSLCEHHHDLKTATEDGGFGRAMTRGRGASNR